MQETPREYLVRQARQRFEAKHEAGNPTQAEPFTMRDLQFAIMQAHTDQAGRIYAAHKQLEEDLTALHARAVTAGLIGPNDPLPTETKFGPE